MNVPSEPKTYTTIYDDFKGVDFTNDASNVFKKRSPTGRNMLPDLDGRPYKRPGWEVKVTAAEFVAAYNDGAVDPVDPDTPVVPEKTHYFELGGREYLMIFNSLGVFYYTDGKLTYLNEYIPIGGTPLNPSSFPPDTNHVFDDLTGDVPIDPRRAFFFEGGGTAGFYLFVGMRLFRFDGMYLYEIEPKIPYVLAGCDADGAGTMLSALNLLTPKRMISYTCDGSNKVFKLPTAIAATSTKVEMREPSTGTWKTLPATVSGTATSWSLAGKTLTITGTAPGLPIGQHDGEDYLRVTYAPSSVGPNDGAAYDVTTPPMKRQLKRIVREYAYERTNGHDTPTINYEEMPSTVTFEWVNPQTYTTVNAMIDHATKERIISVDIKTDTEGSWTTVSDPSIRYSAYSCDVQTTPTDEYLDHATPSSDAIYSDHTRTYKGYEQGYDIYYHERIKTTIYDTNERITWREFMPPEVDVNGTVSTGKNIGAFSCCGRTLVFGTGIINQVFFSASPLTAYNTRVWYSSATDPTYIPDTNYIEVGATDKPVMGMMPIGSYLGVIKKGTSNDTAIYLAYPTTFEEDTTYAVRQNINGIGSISNGAFNILNAEPLFLSKEGVMGIEVSEQDTDRQIKSRSVYINKKLCAEPGLSEAISFVHKGMYFLALNNRCYVLDGSQKSSWANAKTNLQYECYYLENIPAQCFARLDGELYFTDFHGNLCRFKDKHDEKRYSDAYSTDLPRWTATTDPATTDYVIDVWDLDGDGTETGYLMDNEFNILFHDNDSDEDRGLMILHGVPQTDEHIVYGDTWYTIVEATDDTVTVEPGVSITAEWSTIADDDGATHFFKNLKKKGTLISLLPASDSGVDVYIKADNKEPVYAGSTDAANFDLPYEFYAKKKIKKYKRLQFICRNSALNDAFGIDQIIKTYTMGNYSKNKR